LNHFHFTSAVQASVSSSALSKTNIEAFKPRKLFCTVPFNTTPVNSTQVDSIRFVLSGNVQFSYVCQYYATSSIFKVPRVTSSAKQHDCTQKRQVSHGQTYRVINNTLHCSWAACLLAARCLRTRERYLNVIMHPICANEIKRPATQLNSIGQFTVPSLAKLG